MNIKEIKHAYFIGIGGIGMSALARYLLSRGARVSGYDKTRTALTDELTREGMQIHFEDNPDLLPDDADLVVYTPAVPDAHRELNFFRRGSVNVRKRSEVLGAVTESSPTIAVAGTHGKTTVSTMVSYLLRGGGLDCSAFLGGIAVNFDSNFLSGREDLVVVEADEYDRSFLRLTPETIILNSMDADHLDIYETAENVRASFLEFIQRLAPGGTILAASGLPLGDIPDGGKLLFFALEGEDDFENAHYTARDIRVRDGAYEFHLETPEHIAPDGLVMDFRLNMGGRHNVRNAVAALAAALERNCSPDDLREALMGFRGVRRRFEYAFRAPGVVLIDDYAHHPEELRGLISSAREMYPGRKVEIVFQPHLFSRTRDFARGFAESLALADGVFLLPIYPAREEPIPGVDAAMLADAMGAARPVLLRDGEDFLEKMQGREFQVLLMAGAGDISELVSPAARILSEKQSP